MEDTIFELRTHLDFMMKAHGRVLITGLGLGCVVRGCLANPAVEQIICVEHERDVLKLVGANMPGDKRLKIVMADALKWCDHPGLKFDCAWHDLWSNPDKKEKHLHLMHAELLAMMVGKVKFQGAWDFPRAEKRLWRQVAKLI